MLNPFVIAKNEQEKCYIEATVNSVRVNVRIKKSPGMDEMLSEMYQSFLSIRADQFHIIRKKPALENYDFSFLIVEHHLERFRKEELINFILEFIVGIEKEITDMRLSINTQCRIAATFFASGVANK